MRQLLLQVPQESQSPVVRIAQDAGATNIAAFPADSPDGPVACVFAHVPNSQVGRLLDAVEDVATARVSFLPQGVFALHPPPQQASEQVLDVESRSSVEILLAGLQSIGSWRGFLSYAALAGVVAWVGLVTETTYLLVAAMLIAPFAGPAMNAAIATARGDRVLLRSALVRYVAALAVTVAVAAAITLLTRLRAPTDLMRSTAQVSALTGLLPLSAGAAGALQLVQSERSSLVSGAAVGLLISAALAPPAALIGIAVVLMEWTLVHNAAFLLVLQLAGINLAGSIVFRAFGVAAAGSRYPRGRPSVTAAALVTNLVALAALALLQFAQPPSLQRSSIERRAASQIVTALQDMEGVQPVTVDAQITGLSGPGPEVLVADVRVEDIRRAPTDGGPALPTQVRDVLAARLLPLLPSSMRTVVDVTVVQAVRDPTS